MDLDIDMDLDIEYGDNWSNKSRMIGISSYGLIGYKSSFFLFFFAAFFTKADADADVAAMAPVHALVVAIICCPKKVCLRDVGIAAAAAAAALAVLDDFLPFCGMLQLPWLLPGCRATMVLVLDKNDSVQEEKEVAVVLVRVERTFPIP